MNSSNVDFYIAGFDADGKRVGSIICDFNPEKDPKKLKEALAEAKEKFPEAVVVEPIGADAFNQYLDGYIRGTDGKPVEYIAPEPIAEEKKAAEAAKIAAKYEPQLAELKNNLITAVLLDDKELQTEIKEEYTQMMTDYNKELEAL
ncbi:MAG: hypothetical protein E6330_04820 [Dialister sp.]|nr:hypothetical protein [Dialister sp.]